MNIKELSDEQKSVMLARLCGWATEHVTQEKMEMLYGKHSLHMARMVWRDNFGVLYPFGLPNFYNTANMSLAWRVLNWAAQNGIAPQMDVIFKYQSGWTTMKQLPPEEAQRAWLDEILELAIEAELVDLRAEERKP